MKNSNIYKIAALSIFTTFISCKDFEEINIDPLAANIDQVQTEYFINNSIIGTQQNPHIAERVFILYWKAAGRMDRINTLPIGVSNDDWTRDYYDYLAGWQTNVNTAIKVAENLEKQGKAEDYVKNLKQVARIWRVYLLSEGVDNFGPYPISKFDGSNPEFSSVEEVYKFMLKELKEASETMIDNVNVEDRVAKLDPAYRYDFDKWKRYANSMRMRLSMRISEVSPDIAKQNFEDAAKSNKFIESLSQNFQVEEKPGWSDLTGVMSREWNNQYLSSTANNLYIGLGGIKSSELLSNYSQDLKNYIKPENYLGVKYDKHFATKTNDPSAGFWFDGLHYSMDPRAYKAYPIPGNFEDPQFNYYPSWSKKNVTETKRTLINVEDKKVLKEINAKYTWNTYSLGDWGEKAAINNLFGWPGTLPRLVTKFRDSSAKRIFFASWETYFLIAEASLKGWSVPIEGKTAYEKGIKESFEYWGTLPYYDKYIASDSYNKNGTSVKWEHTTEPSPINMDYMDGYSNQSKTVIYEYPKNKLYKNGTIKNDQLTKIITQKFIAQLPWLPLETWSDHRRLGLPFFDNPAIEQPLPGIPTLNDNNYKESKIEFFPQRLPYPSNLKNNVPKSYRQAVELLGGEDNVHTPLWWAKKK
ncbi:SusD/RagB family nutrient-binding outer membrane lipoprotein [Ornithobacterium rhinotracheale]|uniref:SusD/RagB family nutrient-binding outer membrane lipoprotein n=3 Tax=Ornithobacterium rhinotracheale TaxID=28251 RepID=I3ZXN0_ORNRL|nr:SusD/RagB family nutrient-binding outer membrane lipoprotein [Ornithobacterium rhinotracheale]AFL96464.1 hypothetical protein Ornrh_0242 [Ornithobacterium rhinotracheale DSM 15997]AIP98673.1 hypothetical protein Q785_01325 [Ornithobacterium rhinotracheale ORT-UMN 88]KGB67662.1 hypothetical protein Q787_01290 [Ornithobacterium rhinotracheale H06-030791]MCK0194792.1 SusD/RagB family nutrient-binding outer membrane lipoprotein [Ornithobacterium rhinotracheale]MCK0200741.1 SusD/RagB family nutr